MSAAAMEDSVVAGLTARLSERRADMLRDLQNLLRIPSVNAPGHPLEPLRDCAAAVATLAGEAGLENVRLLEVPDAAPYVYGDWLHAAGRPTVLLYAHYDVQPVGQLDGWSTPPFEPNVRAGRLYGRGAADDKAGIMVHLAAVRAMLDARGALPLNIRLLVEGEEENGSAHCKQFLARDAHLLRCDLMVIADSSNVEVGRPAITHSLRGATTLTIELRAMPSPVHSGIWGGVVPDSLMALCKILARLTDDRGEIAVPGFVDDLRPPRTSEPARTPALEEAAVRSHTGLVPSAILAGDPGLGLNDRLWYYPCLTIRGLDAPPVVGSPNVIQGSARAQLNVRLGPGQDPELATHKLIEFITANVPWGLEVHITRGSAYPAWYADPSSPVFQAAARAAGQAFGVPASFIGIGGSVPLVGWFLEALGPVEILLTGVEDPESNAHGPDESLDLAALDKACLAEALLFDELLSALV